MSDTRPPGFRRATDPMPPGVVVRPPEPELKDLQLPLPLPRTEANADLDALKDGAAMMLQAGNRVAALALLWSAVAIDPIDLAAHRRLAATLANGGDLEGAAGEYARYIEFLLPIGELGRATLELQYGASTLGDRHALHAAAEKIVEAVRSIVPLTDAGIASPFALQPAAQVITSTTSAAFTAPRLLPKVPFRFCLHPGGDRQWMQLEGGTPGLVPDAVRVIDNWDNVVEERLCMPLAKGEGHAPNANPEEPALTWVVVGIPIQIAAAYEKSNAWTYTFQAKVNDEWLALDLHDSGCRLERHRAIAAS
jgi:hypothetical protein